METKLDANSVVNTLGDALKLASNLTDLKKEGNGMNDNSNNTQTNPNQTVQIQLANGEEKKEKKPMVIREKPVTHIHKEFPDERALTDKECELALAKAKMDQDYRFRKMEYDQRRSEALDKEYRERREQDRKDRLEREAKAEKRSKIRAVVAGIIGALSIGLVGYGIYSDAKNNRPIQGEGSVK